MENVQNWEKLTWQEKREERFKRWLALDVRLRSKEAEKLYKERVTRFIKVIKLEEPDRVPVALPSGMFPAHYAGYTLRDVMYDYEKLKKAYIKFIEEFEMDSFTGPGLVFPGKVLEMTDHRLHKWPGNGLPANASGGAGALPLQRQRGCLHHRLLRRPRRSGLRRAVGVRRPTDSRAGVLRGACPSSFAEALGTEPSSR